MYISEENIQGSNKLCYNLNKNLKLYYWYLWMKFHSQNHTEKQLFLLQIQKEHITVCVVCVS